MRKTAVLLIMILVFAAVFPGCEAPPADITGLWYEKTGLAGTLEFNEDGTVIMVILGEAYNGTYRIDDSTGNGEINISDPVASASSFMLSGSELNVDNGAAIYTRDKVNTKDIGGIIKGLEGSGS